MPTAKQLSQVRFYAAEGLSQRRTAALLGLSAGSIAGLARRNNITFSGEYGAPFGNTNAVRPSKHTPEEKRAANRDAMRRHRAKRRTATARFPLPPWIQQ